MNLFYITSVAKRIFVCSSLTFFLFLSVSSRAQTNPANTRPTLDRIPDHSTRYSTDLHFIELNGITPGGETDQDVSIEVSTENLDLIKSIDADLVGNGKGFIYYRLNEGAVGTATVKVIITDDGATPSSVSRTFHITCEGLNREAPAKPLLLEISDNNLKAFPNPAALSSRIYFSTPNDERFAAVEMFTASGVKIKQLFTGSTLAKQSYSVDLDSRNLATGVYFVRLTGQSPIANLKLVVAR